MDNNYGNSNLGLCFPLEKNIVNLPVDNFSRIGLMDFIVKYRPNLDPSNMVGKLLPLLGSQCYFGLGPVVFLTLLIYLFVSIGISIVDFRYYMDQIHMHGMYSNKMKHIHKHHWN